MYKYIHIHTNIYVYIHKHIYIHICAHMYILYTHIHTYVYMLYIHVYINITHMYILHTHTHTHTYLHTEYMPCYMCVLGYVLAQRTQSRVRLPGALQRMCTVGFKLLPRRHLTFFHSCFKIQFFQ